MNTADSLLQVTCNSILFVSTDVAARLRRQGYRITPQRMLVLEALSAGGPHVPAERIHEQVVRRFPHVNLSTIYRTLDLLEAEGIVRSARLGEGRRVFELSSAEDPHHHLVCRDCGTIEHIAGGHLADVESHLLDEHGFEVDETVLTSFGRCRRCRRSRRAR